MDLIGFETKNQDLAPPHRFASRLLASLAAAAGIVGVSLLAGMGGYCSLEGMSLIDGFLNAAMILSGMGPVTPLTTTSGKLFAGCFALYSGLALVATTGIVLAPVVHRFLHRFHVDETDGS